MPPLAPELRKLLENKIPNVRQVAGESARAILDTLAVNRPEPFVSMTTEQRRLRNALRAKARQLGNGSQVEGFEPLVEELAYYQWHRMVFARFLAENNLLMHPSGVPVTLQECGELAQEEGEVDAWAVAARYASLMLPGIFRQDDPESQVRPAPEGQQKLEVMLNSLPSPVFLADDSLGWMYQFWQSHKKEEINHSGRKIDGKDLAPVTQLFTEDYMVHFMLENALGAWWAARHPDSPLIKEWKYLRFNEDGTPAAGTFPGWPDKAAEVTVMDPCCGSGHFLVRAFEMLVPMRMAEEGLSDCEAAEAVLRDNLFGLEIDPRCTQIAAFSLVLMAWKTGGYHVLPVPNIACSGIPVQGQLETWLKLARDDSRLRAGLERLYGLFTNAPDLGSLINPADLPAAERMFVADYEQVAPLLEQALAKERNVNDLVAEVFGAAVEGIVSAARLLARKYTLVATNVPYLVIGKQSDVLKAFCNYHYHLSKNELATVFIERCLTFCTVGGSSAIVTPQSWLFLGTYKKIRAKLLETFSWNIIAKLGPRAFETISGEVVNVALDIFSQETPCKTNKFIGLDVSTFKLPSDKANGLRISPLYVNYQLKQMSNPDNIITFSETLKSIPLLGQFAKVLQGVGTTDTPRFVVRFWEVIELGKTWDFYQLAPEGNEFSGYTSLLRWEDGKGDLAKIGTAHKGKHAIGKRGFAIAVTRNRYVAAFLGTRFDCTAAVLLANKERHVPAVRAFLLSPDFEKEVRRVDQALSVTESSFGKIRFDIEHWQVVAEAFGPLPEPHSVDPTQWLFKGHLHDSKAPLQVAVARLLDYRWPQQQTDALNDLADEEGILCLPPVAGETPAAEHLRKFLAKAYGDEWSPNKQAKLIESTGSPGKTLEEWLRDDFFNQHCRLFHNRPFIWHIWDGRKDGFSALVNYHKLTAANLERLIYTYLGDWINFQRGRRDYGEPDADERLVAALELQNKLKLIRQGEPPYDIYVRWKTLAEQPIGWDPDLNDGVRLNIRPFVTAGVLRTKFTINWKKDRGKNPDDSERLNDLHFTIAEKQAARREKL